MGEYGREQRSQLSRAIANSESGSRQLKGIVDNRLLLSSQIMAKKYFQSNEVSQLKHVSNLTRLTRENVRSPWVSTSPGTSIDDEMRIKIMKPLKKIDKFREHVGGHLMQESMGGSGAFKDGNILPWSRDFEENVWTANVDQKIQSDINKTLGWCDVYLELSANYELGGSNLSNKIKKSYPDIDSETEAATQNLPMNVSAYWGIGRVEDIEMLTDEGNEYEQDKYGVQIAGNYNITDFEQMHGVTFT